MRKILFISFLFILSFRLIYAQELKKQKVIDDKVRTSHTFYVLKENPKIKQGEYIYKYRNSVQIKGQFENNMQVGEWTYSPDKNLKIVGNYQDGKKDGEWKYYYNNNLISLLNYHDGVLEGKSFGYFENGKVASEFVYVNDHRTDIKLYYEDGTLKQSIENNDNKLFDHSGDLICELKFKEGSVYDLNILTDKKDDLVYDGDLKDGNGKLKQYRYNEKSKVLSSITNYKNGKLDGEAKFFDSDGNLLVTGQFTEGVMTGSWDFNISVPEKRFIRVYNLSENKTKEPIFSEQLNSIGGYSSKLDIEPKFSGESTDKFGDHIVLALKYPEQAAARGIYGNVLTQFKVNMTGLLKDFEILNENNKLLNNEAERVIRTSPLWSPGFSNRFPTEVSYRFYINFILP